MLQSLYIKNYAIIEEALIPFHSKLNIITGETGAGKSILMGALGLILGERADTKVLHHDTEKCVVEGTFDIRSYSLQNYFEQSGLDYDSTCSIRREITGNGKSRAFINDTPVSLQQLKELGSILVDIVSQNQTLELNNRKFQLEVLDAFAESTDALNQYRSTFTEWRRTTKLLDELIERELQARKDEDYMKFILKELSDAKLLPGEMPQLEQQLEVLSHAEQIRLAAAQCAAALTNNEQSVTDVLNGLKQQLLPVARHHSGIQNLAERLQSTLIELKDISDELEQIAEKTEADPQKLALTEERLQLLFSLQKKHHAQTTDELIELQHKLEDQVHSIGSLQNELVRLHKEKEKLEAELAQKALLLSDKRKQAVGKMEKAIKQLLKQVQMPDAVLEIQLTTTPAFTENGSDDIEYRFSANKGVPLQPMNKVASGGELSRLMLCIKSLINDKVALPSIVFDEIDTGISGEAALKVSQVLKQHAASHQVIAITHLPQIAGKADAHFYVYKTSSKNATYTHIKQLNENERVEEIARMLHGENPSERVIEAARELMG
ncbi:MAG: DNA repair protein RecN [Bacteroidota bacterium]